MERMNLLISDLDGTLLGDDASTEVFAMWYANARKHYRLVYSSGRFVESILESIASSALPEPDAIIGGVGTQIYDVAQGREFSMWPPLVIEWNPYIVQSIGEDCAELKLQPSKFNSHYKVSFYGNDLDESFLRHLEERMASEGLSASIVYSSQRDLDLLPLGSNKGAAALYLSRRWKVDPDRTLGAGDSGNDADMFHVGFRGIVVGNAAPDLKALASPTNYLAENNYAAGVLEGIRYWQKDRIHATHERVGIWN
jgi:sucrose-6F-phosphate phosphohydrolase